MLCAISGEVPQVPVVSKKNGLVFEKNLIESHIKEYGSDPISQQELGLDDLVEIQSARVARPRPPTFTSIPSLLSEFQKEWDAIALETFNLRQQLQQTRQELSTALYQNDAAVRVIARIGQERDEARKALSKLSIHQGTTTNGDSMLVDARDLPTELAAQVDATHDRLSKTRRKRSAPENWADSTLIRAFQSEKGQIRGASDITSVALNGAADAALLGSKSGMVEVLPAPFQEATQKFYVAGGAVTAVTWSRTHCIVALSTGSIKVFDDGQEVRSNSRHSDAVTGIAVHPSGSILASVSLDKSLVFHDFARMEAMSQLFTESALTSVAFHPDGQLLATGAVDGHIKIFNVKNGSEAASFPTSGAVRTLNFSENGIWLLAASKANSDVQVWDLRKGEQVQSLEVGYPVECARLDYTGQFLALAGSRGVAVFQYSKSAKTWTELMRNAIPSVAVEWGSQARSLIVLGSDGALSELQ